jgi:hypothetical protein
MWKPNRKQKTSPKTQQTPKKQEDAQLTENPYQVSINALPDAPAPTKIDAAPFREWHDPREEARYMAEVERRRAMAEVYRFLTPPK